MKPTRLFLCLVAVALVARAAEKPIPVKAVIVVTYEDGAYTGDKPGGQLRHFCVPL